MLHMSHDKITDIKFEGIDHSDYPEYEDVHIVSANKNGEPMISWEIDELNKDRDFVYEKLIEHLF